MMIFVSVPLNKYAIWFVYVAIRIIYM